MVMMSYVCHLHLKNITVNRCIGNISTHQHLYGQTPDICPALCFQFYEPVYYSDIDSFPAPIEKRRVWVSFVPNVWDTLTLHILTDDTHCIIYHPAVHSALIKNEKNLHLKFSLGQDDPHKLVKQVLHTQDRVRRM